MSIKVMTYVFEHSEATLGARLVHLALADYAHDDGTKAFPSLETLCAHAKMSRRGVQDALRRLEADGAIVHTGVTRTGTKIYSVVMDRGADSARGADASAGGAESAGRGAESDQRSSSSAPDPLTTRQGPPIDPTAERERARAKLRFNGKVVDESALQMAEDVLAEFNRQADPARPKALLTGAGELSEAGKRIYGRVIAYPDLKLEEYADIIRRTLASRWWKEGPPTVGVVFGPKVFDENMTRPEAGAPTTDHQRQVEAALARVPQMSEEEIAELEASVGLEAA